MCIKLYTYVFTSQSGMFSYIGNIFNLALQDLKLVRNLNVNNVKNILKYAYTHIRPVLNHDTYCPAVISSHKIMIEKPCAYYFNSVRS